MMVEKQTTFYMFSLYISVASLYNTRNDTRYRSALAALIADDKDNI